MSFPFPDFVKEVGEPLSVREEAMLKSPELYCCTLRSPPALPRRVPPVMVGAADPIINKPPEERVRLPSSVSVELEVSFNELILVPAGISTALLKLTLFAGAQVVGSVLVV